MYRPTFGGNDTSFFNAPAESLHKYEAIAVVALPCETNISAFRSSFDWTSMFKLEVEASPRLLEATTERLVGSIVRTVIGNVGSSGLHATVYRLPPAPSAAPLSAPNPDRGAIAPVVRF